MAIVVLYGRVAAVVIRVESLCVPWGLMVAHFVELHHGVVATPRPKACGGLAVGQCARAVAHQVVFYQGSVASDGDDAVARDFLYQVFAYDGTRVGMPMFAVAVTGPDDAVPLAPPDDAVFHP